MKKLIKSRIFAFILGAIIFGSVGVIAANYAASTIDYTTSKNSNVKTVKDALDDLYIKSKNVTLLWENENPTSDFQDQTINLNLSKYNYVLIKTKRAKADTTENGFRLNPQFTIISVDGNGYIMGMDGNYAFHFMRDVSVTKSTITFSKAYRRGYNLPSEDNNISTAIPLEIYGLTGNINVNVE